MRAEPVAICWMWAVLDVPRDTSSRAWDFWAAATRASRSPGQGEEGELATLVPAYGDPWVKLQRVGDGGGVRVDLDVEDPRAAAEAAVGLGATVVADRGHLLMRSPGGFIFCFSRPHGESHQVREGEADLLDQVCLDLPLEVHDTEVSFWAALTGWEPVRSDQPEFGYLRRPEDMPLRLLFQRLEEAEGPVRGHVDLACVEREATLRQHIRLGADELAQRDFWTVLRDPAGLPYCLTDRSPTSTWVAPA